MRSSVVRGMPYATMTYPTLFQTASSGQRICPTIVSEFPLQGNLIVDGSSQIGCSAGTLFTVQNDVKISFQNGLQWMVFVSESVSFQCSTTSGTSFALQVVGAQNSAASLTMRLALVVPEVNENQVAQPTNAQYVQGYTDLLREYAQVYPGEDSSVSFEVDNNAMQASLTFDWDATRMDGSSESTSKMLMYALPHHQEKLSTLDGYCTASVLGRVCFVEGSSWTIVEELPEVSFRAPRRPPARHLSALANSVKTDLAFRIPDNFQIGAGDTYFGAKSMAKLARILVIAEEVQEICSSPGNEYGDACQNSNLPSDEEMNSAVAHLRQVLDVWFSTSAEAPFIYDPAWGGVVSCGCYYDNGHCINSYPNCPSFTDQGLNFGNGTLLFGLDCSLQFKYH
jgi:endoglucanase Acf2